MSHTVKISVEFSDPDTLQAAVLALGGKWLGQGTHHLYGGTIPGYGFRLPGWTYPLVLQEGGNLQFDDYNGSWGNVKDLDRLKVAYQVAVAEVKAAELGWLCERTADGGLLVHHPAGGSLLVAANGSADATGFQGGGCLDALLALGIEGEYAAKAEYAQVPAVVSQQG